MNILQRAKTFVQSLHQLAKRSAWDWRQCPKCGDTDTCRWGAYPRHPWFIFGRRTVVVQRHMCNRCSRHGKYSTYSELSPLMVRGSWYAREVHRFSIDLWQHVGTSLRRAAELARSVLGRQERWLIWRVFGDEPSDAQKCHLAASTVHRWLDGAGRQAEKTVPSQLEGVTNSEQVGTDGLWAVLRGGSKRVILMLVDSVSGVIWPPVVVEGEENPKSWGQLFRRAALAGLNVQGLKGITSDGARGLLGYVSKALGWVNHQRCVLHIWRNLAGELAKRVAEAVGELTGDAAQAVRKQARKELVALVHGVLDARSEAAADVALAKLASHRLGAGLAKAIEKELDSLFVHLLAYNAGLMRVVPEWYWRDFRLRLSRGRNHGSEVRLERAGLVWAVYHNFTPAQWRSERQRHYRRPGKSPLEMAGVPPGRISYLDALGV